MVACEKCGIDLATHEIQICDREELPSLCVGCIAEVFAEMYSHSVYQHNQEVTPKELARMVKNSLGDDESVKLVDFKEILEKVKETTPVEEA